MPGPDRPLQHETNTALGFGLGRCVSLTDQEPALLVAIADELTLRGLLTDLLESMSRDMRTAVTLQITVARQRAKRKPRFTRA